MRKKLIEVALPLEAINRESAREKSIRHGHPSTLHLWWARRPLAACRAVLFTSIVDDPDQEGVPEALLQRIDELPLPDDRGESWARLSIGEQRRQRLFAFIEKLVTWENSTNEEILTAARGLIHAATGGNPPPVMDPFCGGGSIPLEAQRLGLEAHASDLNPVAVLITKALIEIPPKFANQPPVNPEDREKGMGARWKGAAGLAADVRYYGKLMRDEAARRVGYLYPKVTLPPWSGGGEATVIAWLWARTVKCPNPACGAQMPLVRSFWLSTKKGKEAWVEPIVDRGAKTVRFEVRTGKGDAPDGTVNRRGAMCIMCGGAVPFEYIRFEGKSSRMSSRLLAIVTEGRGGRHYVCGELSQEVMAASAHGGWTCEEKISHWPGRTNVVEYGMTRFGDLFTPRQLVALTTFSDLVAEARERARRDAVAAGVSDDSVGLSEGGTGADAYADAVGIYLAFAVDRLVMTGNSLVRWNPVGQKAQHAFGRQALPMIWDFAEPNFFADATGSVSAAVELAADPLEGIPCLHVSSSLMSDATRRLAMESHIVATDPPYYDNIGYADLSDFFYIWLRRSLDRVFPHLFDTLLTPKGPELIASLHRFGGDPGKARAFFEEGLGQAFGLMQAAQSLDFPLTIFYAFKQSEVNSDDDEEIGTGRVSSTGWETMLEGLILAGFSVTGTWPIRTEMKTRQVAGGTNALASSIVLVCRPRPADAPLATRKELLASLKRELPDALRKLQHGNIAPVDLAQAAIGPGMAVFSRYSKVVESDGSPMRVRTALQLINQALDEVLAEQEGEYDPETRWAVAWFEQYGTGEGPYGTAETLSKAKDCSIQRMVEAGIVQARAGKVRLRPRDELTDDWDPTNGRPVTAWEATQRLAQRALQGDQGAAAVAAKIPELADIARDLAYRLYVTSERKGWTQEALAYNGLVVAWPEIVRLAAKIDTTPLQPALHQ